MHLLVALTVAFLSAFCLAGPFSSGQGDVSRIRSAPASAGSGITSLNGELNTTQTFATGSAGTDFAISSSGGTHTFDIPTASSSNRGLLSSSDWTTFNGKQAAGNYITALTGDVTASGPGSASASIPAATVTGKALTGFSASAGTVSASDTILQGFNKLAGWVTAFQTEQVDGFIETPSDKTYVIRLNAKYAGTIANISLKTASGTITAKLTIEGIDVTGCTSISVSSAETTATCNAANTFSAGHTIALVTSSNSSAADLQFSIQFTR